MACALALALAACMMLAAARSAYARDNADVVTADHVTYVDAKGEEKTQDTYTAVESDTTTWTTGWYVAEKNVTVDACITCTGDVSLVLSDGATLRADNGISVAGGNSLTIYAQSAGTGTLNARGSKGASGIGGNFRDDNGCGSIIINGGIVTAEGGSNADTQNGESGAGIGGGGYRPGGTVVINGGTVNATGGNRAAGIGGSYQSGGGTITINGGTVNAEGKYKAAGIGGGYKGGGDSITITGGGIRAVPGGYNGTWGSPIGAGNGGTAGTVIILGGNFAEGDMTNNTVYGCLVGANRHVQANGAGGAYPYSVVKAVPTAANLTYTEPTNLAYDGNAKAATVTPGTGVGAVTVKYYDATDTQVEPINVGTYTVKADVAEGDDYTAATGIELGAFSIVKATPVITVAPTTGEVAVPNTTTFTVTASDFYDGTLEATSDNTEIASASFSDGTLRASSDSPEIATASLSRGIVTITARKPGTATITVSAPSTANCVTADATYTVTVKAGEIAAVAPTDTTVDYDGKAHQAGYVSVGAPTTGYTVSYGTADGVYDLTEAPSYTDPGTYRIYWQVTADGYETSTGSWAFIVEGADSPSDTPETPASPADPTDPNTPTTPSTPSEPSTSTEPVAPSTTTTSDTPASPATATAPAASQTSAHKSGSRTTASTQNDPMPQTGDETNQVLPLAFAVLGMAAIIAGVSSRTRRAPAAHLRR